VRASRLLQHWHCSSHLKLSLQSWFLSQSHCITIHNTIHAPLHHLPFPGWHA
jgi:hypothetical protein